MKSSRSAGLDNITSNMIKEMLPVIENQLTNLVNTSIETNQYPKTLKKSKLLPLIKNATPPKSPSDPASYRGINIIMTIGKIIDKIVLKQVLEYLTENEIIHQAHHGAIRGKSTTTAIATLIDTWSNAIENGDEIAVVALDQSSAYDMIDHKILISKL